MSAHLSTALHRLVNMGSASAKPGSSGSPGLRQSEQYEKALGSYFKGDFLAVLTRAGDLIAENPDCAERFHAYRLWIEAAAELGDKKSLRLLKKHLFNRGQEDVENHGVYFALRGLVHFELDEFGAAQIFSEALTHGAPNAYALELIQRVQCRVAPLASRDPEALWNRMHLLHSQVALDDYFHWRYVCQDLLRAEAEDLLAIALEFLGRAFPGAPDPLLYEFHRCVDRGYFAASASVAERLLEIYPMHPDYLYFCGYALFEDGDYPSARKVLVEAQRVTSGKDAEIQTLLGHCHAKLGGAKEASELLRRVLSIFASEGLPTAHIALEYLEVMGELRDQTRQEDIEEMPREPRGYFVELSPRRVYELMESPENVSHHLIRPIGSEAMPGDLCFFTTRDDRSSQWKMVAVYAVESEPMWHPLGRYQSILKHVTTFPKAIPVDFEPMSPEAEATFFESEPQSREPLDFRHLDHLAKTFGIHVKRQNHMFRRIYSDRATIYQLDSAALSVVEQVIAEHRNDMVERRNSLMSRRPTA